MMELRARTRKGRTIWIITHLREAARYADITYLVEKGPNGSSIRLNDDDLDEPVDAAGLLSVMT
jgi:DNA repair exonuclease SbcCD ATPase subunit